MTAQTHLSTKERINLGSFYTNDFLVQYAYNMLKQYVEFKEYVLLDSSCGSGNFLDVNGFAKIIGIDIDKTALKIARNKLDSSVILYHKNALSNVSRESFNIAQSSKLVIIGNPPYNDRTSIVQNALKNKDSIPIDSTFQARDIGISFLRSYERLRADFICVLHPLSYLIKKTNFKALKDFSKAYRLLDSMIISSKEFCKDSKGHFPIIIALYQRDDRGMDYSFISNFSFKTIEGKSFKLNSFDFIAQYIDKYPNKNRVLESKKVAMFYTLRDINALSRSKTFMQKENSNTIYVTQETYSLYCYVDVFKAFLPHIHYYFGNCDMMIDFKKFKVLESAFYQSK